MIWFTADTHFGHANIIKYSNRPFKTVDEMNNVLIENINQVVKDNDILYHLGDWSFDTGEEYRHKVKCKNIILILGNHDKRLKKSLFKEVHPHRIEIVVNEQSIVLDHYAMKVWNKSHHGAWHLYGHSHGSLPDDPNSLSFDVGVDCWNYWPISIDGVAEQMSKKTFIPINDR